MLLLAYRGLNMKKILTVITIILFGTLVFAEPIPNQNQQNQQLPQDLNNNSEQKSDAENQDKEEPIEIKEEPIVIIKLQNPDFMIEEKGSQKFYYDKQGKFIAREKKINNQNFFYNQVGQMVGKSIKRNSNTYYYNGINKFMGYCTEQECFDEDFKSTGTIPPLPAINGFKPVIDLNILNPQAQSKPSEEE